VHVRVLGVRVQRADEKKAGSSAQWPSNGGNAWS
jgi:hypothetical protein